MVKKWIQKIKMKRGSLHRQLGIEEGRNIPVRLLIAIKKARIGEKIKNPTKTGKKVIKVTTKLKRRVILALTLRKLAKRRKR